MTTVFIWNNNQITSRIAKLIGHKAKSHQIVGHASVNIDDNFSPMFEEGTYNPIFNPSHVSFVPGDRYEGGRMTGALNPSFFFDLSVEHYAPDHIIRIPTPPPAHIYRMKQEAEKYMVEEEGKEPQYDFHRMNCSRIASRILRSGWKMGRGNIRFGQVASGIWTPLMVKRLAMSLKGGRFLSDPAFTMTWEDFTNELEKKGVIRGRMRLLLRLFRRRAANRGSSGGRNRFEFRSGNIPVVQGTHVLKGKENFPGELLAYAELLEGGMDRPQAKNGMKILLEANYPEMSLDEQDALTDKYAHWYDSLSSRFGTPERLQNRQRTLRSHR